MLSERKAFNKKIICRTGEQVWTYEDYLQTNHWKAVKSEVITRAHCKCTACGRGNIRLDVHHLHYKTIGNEDTVDLIAVCRKCHKRIHTKELRSSKPIPAKRIYPETVDINWNATTHEWIPFAVIGSEKHILGHFRRRSLALEVCTKAWNQGIP